MAKFSFKAKSIIRAMVPARIYKFASTAKRNGRELLQKWGLLCRIAVKWLIDKRALPLTNEHWSLYVICHRLFWREFQDFPNLTSPRDFNDRIQWLKLFDQSEEQIRCSDKIKVRDYVREKVGDEYLVDVYQNCASFDEIDFERLPESFVIKVNHDSGSVVLVRDKGMFDRKAARAKIETALKQRFGWDYGEWAYAFVRPRVLVEEFIEPDASSPPPDYKFYVVNGKVKFMHFISERGADTKEQTVSPEGEDLATSLYPAFSLGTSFRKPACWEEMKRVAECLGQGFKCVRVDLFESQGRIYAGELTFWPMFGCYKGEGQKKLGALLDFDRSTFRPPIYHRLPKIAQADQK